METVGPSATVPGIFVVEPRPAFAHTRFEMKNNGKKEGMKARNNQYEGKLKRKKETPAAAKCEGGERRGIRCWQCLSERCLGQRAWWMT